MAMVLFGVLIVVGVVVILIVVSSGNGSLWQISNSLQQEVVLALQDDAAWREYGVILHIADKRLLLAFL